VLSIFQKYREFRQALEAGDYRRAARLVVEVLDLLVPEDGTEDAIREPVGAAEGFDEEGFKEDVKKVKAALPKKATPKLMGAAADPKGAGGAIAIALLITFGPLIAELIRKRLKDRQG
jgi:alkanesulfonate monooxygenase SsuD/methylene tetrahydromethanopterin reductase-like flavin-dependent oxidoreductase (luciferase family)